MNKDIIHDIWVNKAFKLASLKSTGRPCSVPRGKPQIPPLKHYQPSDFVVGESKYLLV